MTPATTKFVTACMFTLTDGREVQLRVVWSSSVDEFVVRAHDHTGTIVGLAVCDPDGPHAGVAVTVAAEWRRAGLGAELLRRTAGEAGRRRVTWLLLHYPVGEVGCAAWLQHSGLVTARRVHNGMVRAAVLTPGAFEPVAQAA